MNELTDYGFNFGSLEVTRVCKDEIAAVIKVKTPKASINIRATKTGNIRFYNDDSECVLVDKKYLEQLTEGK
jgi:hypothetical protein